MIICPRIRITFSKEIGHFIEPANRSRSISLKGSQQEHVTATHCNTLQHTARH